MGSAQTCAVSADGALYCWGGNVFGQLGAGGTTAASAPLRVGTETWGAVSSGGAHTCAVRAHGGLFCWGDNDYGQIDMSGSADAHVPTEVCLPSA